MALLMWGQLFGARQMSQAETVLSEVPKWITMFISIFAVIATMAVGYGTTQTRIDAVATRQAEHATTINTIERKIVLVERELLRDRITIEFIQDAIVELTNQTSEALEINRKVVEFINKIEDRENQK
tara:strand:+ start:461 stop:841 length:381 start_codon:yes stop_codon:yes gene_type:complete